MARIAGADLPPNKRIVIALQKIKGIGHTSAKKICADVGIDESCKVTNLTPEQGREIIQTIEKNFVVEGELVAKVRDNIKILTDLGAYRGLRHRRRLPVRGQRTKTNARTRKGPKKTIANKKK